MSVEEINKRLLAGQNPFEPTILPFDRALDVPDVHEIHAKPTEELLRAVELTKRDGKSRGLILRGESGTGKTHLIRRVSHKLGRKALFAAIDPIGDPTRLIRHIVRRVVVELSAPCEPCGSLLREMAGALIGEGLYAIPDGPAKDRLVARMLDARGGFMQQDRTFALDCIEAFSRALARTEPLLDLNVVKVLLRLWLEDQTDVARDWLKGIDLDDEERKLLHVARSLEQEDDAENALRTLVAAARLFRPIVLCFDQTETLASLGGERVVIELFKAIARLEALPGLVVLFTCLEDVWSQSYEKLARSLNPRPLTNANLSLMRLGPREARAIIAARLRRVYLEFDPPYPTYPVPERTIEAMQDLSPREMLDFCSRRLEDMKRAGAIREIEPPQGMVESDDDPMSALGHEWDEAKRQWQAKETDAQILIDGLFQLLRVAQDRKPEGWPVAADLVREEGDAALTVSVDARRVRVVASDTQNGNSLSKLVERMIDRIDKIPQEETTLLRMEDEKQSWKVAKGRLEELRRRGGKVVRPGEGVLAALGTVRHLLGRVAAGDVTTGKRRVTDREATTFLAAMSPLGQLLRGVVER